MVSRMGFPRSEYGRGLARAALMCAAIAFGGAPGPVAAQEMPRGVATDLVDAALRDTLDTPPQRRPLPRSPIRFGWVVFSVGTLGPLALVVRRWLRGRRVPVASRPSPAEGVSTSAREPRPIIHRDPRPPRTPINLPPHVVDLLRRNAQRQLETKEPGELADRGERVPPGYDVTPRPPARPRIDFWISDFGAGESDE